MSSATPSSYNVRYDADLGQIVYEFPSGWIPVPLGDPALNGVIFTAQPAIIKPSVDAVNAIDFTLANGTTSIMSIDSNGRRVGLATTTPAQLLDVNGNMVIGGSLVMGGTTPNAACQVDLRGTTQGIGIPPMTAAQKTAISPNRAGNLIYQTDGTPGVYVNSGSSWGAVGGGGSGLVLQVLQYTGVNTESSTNTMGFDASANYVVHITPASASSRFLVQVSLQGYNDMDRGNFSIMRNGTEVSGTTYGLGTSVTPNTYATITYSFVDSPATASAITYAIGLSASLASVGTTNLGNSGTGTSIIVTELAS